MNAKGLKKMRMNYPAYMISNRIEWIDILKGIGIILVAFAHIYQNQISYNFIYAFHMPLFFMAAGWLYKEKPVFQYIKHRFFTIMIPYFSFGLLILIYWQLIERRFRDSDMTFIQSFLGLIRGEYDCLDFNVHLWFLPCFFLTVIIYNVLRNVIGKKWTFVITAILSLVYIIGTYIPSMGGCRLCRGGLIGFVNI